MTIFYMNFAFILVVFILEHVVLMDMDEPLVETKESNFKSLFGKKSQLISLNFLSATFTKSKPLKFHFLLLKI